MATLILGGVGALVGSAVGGPVGARLGFQIGSVIGSLLDSQRSGTSLVRDLKFSGSSFGANIPRFWGNVRIGCNVIWTLTDANGNTLVPHTSEVSIGGSGGASQTTTTYSATWAFLMSVGTQTYLDGTQVYRPVTVNRIFANDLIVYDTAHTGTSLKLNSNLFLFAGSETQAVSSIIQAVQGTDTCAFRGLAYGVVQDYDLSKFGNQIPSFQVEVSNGPVYLSDVASDIFREAGLSTSQFDVSLVTGILVEGLLEDSQESLSTLLGSLLYAYAVDFVEVDGVIRLIPRGGATSFTIALDDLGAASGQGAKPSDIIYYQTTRVMSLDLPGILSVTHYDPGNDFQQATQTDFRQGVSLENVLNVTLPLSLTPTDARQIAATQLDFAWTERQSYLFTLPFNYIGIAPGDVGYLPNTASGISGNTRIRITDALLSPLGAIQFMAVPDGSQNTNQVVTSGAGPGMTAPVGVIVPTVWTQWSGYEVRPSDQLYPGIYIAACGGSTPGWTGAQVYFSIDAGVTYSLAAVVNQPSVFGVTTGTLSDGGAVVGAFDNTNTVGVDVTTSAGAISSVTDSQIASSLNVALLGNEMIGIGTASLGSAYHYTVSHLKRGLRTFGIPPHFGAQRFIMLSTALTRINFTDDQVGTTVYIKCVSPGQVLSDVTAQTTVLVARTLTSLENKLNSLGGTLYLVTPTQLTSTAPTLGTWTTITLPSVVPSGAMAILVEIPGGGVFNARASLTGLEFDNDGYNANAFTGGTQAILPISSTGTIDVKVIYNTYSNPTFVKIIGYYK